MHYYVEGWKPRHKWLALSAEDRGKFFFDLSPTIQALLDAGVELVGYVVNRKRGGSGAELSFLRVWKMPDKALAQRLEDVLAGTTWHEFFERGDSRGEVLGPQAAIPHLVNP